MLPRTNRSKKLIPFYRDDYILRELKNGREYNKICDYFDNNCKEGMLDKLNKLIKPNGAIVLFGSEPFSSALRMSNIKNYKYDWIWEKSKPTGHLNAKKQPLRQAELISVFYKKQCNYLPQGTLPTNKMVSRTNRGNYGECSKTTKQNVTGYPRNIIKFPSTDGVHQTQKPVALMEYLIKTYTNEGELVLDFTAGSFSTAIACINTNRKFIGIELDKDYYAAGKERIIKRFEEIKNK